MKKNVYLDKNAEKELRKFSEEVQLDFEAYFKILELEGRLDFPQGRKVSKEIFEIRIKLKGEYRGFYAYIGKMDIVILHLFANYSKKRQQEILKRARYLK